MKRSEFTVVEYIPNADEIVTATWVNLKGIVDNWQFRFFTWPNDPPDSELLMIDAFTASAMLKVYDAMSVDNQAKFERMVAAGRGSFGKLVGFTWDHVH